MASALSAGRPQGNDMVGGDVGSRIFLLRDKRFGSISVFVDILEDRNVESCTEWLRHHPEIEVISRDHCGLYAQAASRGATQAVQVAERFHLVQNLRMTIEEQMNMYGRATGRALLSEADNISTDFRQLRSRLAHLKSREEIFATIHALGDQGLSCSEIERQTGFRRRRLLFHEIQQQGYEGSYPHLERLLAGWRRAEKHAAVNPATSSPKLEPVKDPHTGHAISPIIAAALCIKPRGYLTFDQARKVDALMAGSPAFATMRSLTMRFKGILRGGQSDPLGAWIDSAIETIIPIMRFARTLHRDIDAVRNAIELPWSNGQAEGQINRLKTLKRAMYGRAEPELLRSRMLRFRHTL